MTLKYRVIFLILSLIIISVLAGFFLHPATGRVIERERLLMSTIVEIKIPAAGREATEKAGRAIEDAFQEMARIEKVFSIFDEASEVSRINGLEPGERLLITNEVFDSIERSISYSKLTDGAFDITVGPLVALWKKASHLKTIPAEEEVIHTVSRIGYQNIILNRNDMTISFAQEGVNLDLGGIAKGYAVDRAIEILKKDGIRNAIVNMGGNLYCMGKKNIHDKWKIGIRHPRVAGRICLEMELEDKAIATSGDYERYAIIGGKRFSHIIDPRTGYPIGDAVVSASVITDTAEEADALATALCIIAPAKGIELVDKITGTNAIIIYMDGPDFHVATSEKLKGKHDIIEKALR